MNQKSARVFANQSFKQDTLSFEDVPHQSKLFLDFQSNSAKLDKFYPEKQTFIKDFDAKVLENYKTDCHALCDILAEINKSFEAEKHTLEKRL